MLRMTKFGRLLATTLSLTLVSGCGLFDGEVTYSPPLLPIEFAIGQDGSISVSVGREWVTPLGTFGISGRADRPEAPDEGVLLVIRHQVGGSARESRYQLDVDDEIVVLLEGHFYQRIKDNVVTIAVVDGVSSIRIVDAESPEAQSPAQGAPAMTNAPRQGPADAPLDRTGDPVRTGCLHRGGHLVSGWVLTDYWGNPLMNIENWYSDGCQTNWAHAWTYAPASVSLSVGPEGRPSERTCVPVSCQLEQLPPFGELWTDMTDGRVRTAACGVAVSAYDQRRYEYCVLA